MQFKSSLPVLSTFLLLFVAQACHAQLMCYICDNCPQITAATPTEECNEAFFNSGGTELPSTMTTTTPMPTTTDDPTTQSTEDEDITMTTIDESTTVLSSSTTESETTDGSTTEEPMPTPPTIGPPVTTTAMPTPPNPGTVVVPVDIVQGEMDKMMTNATTTTTTTTMPTTKAYMNSTELHVRQLRQVIDTGVTYHCFNVQKNDNGTLVNERGCSRVATNEGVCSQLKLMNNDTRLNKCVACSTPLCNGSTSLSISILAVVVGVVASLLRRN